ncbi:hypothetical protein ACIP6P_23310 [Streptomyces sp. NPDC088729]|uniref:hypothetical protein n=1 Tax=Streptomyces sp. NPDC088729 TaxID=3365876 RepID=UPI0038125A8E
MSLQRVHSGIVLVAVTSVAAVLIAGFRTSRSAAAVLPVRPGPAGSAGRDAAATAHAPHPAAGPDRRGRPEAVAAPPPRISGVARGPGPAAPSTLP